MDRSLGIYMHIPFCVKKCNYCDFCSFPKNGETVGQYVFELCNRMEKFSPSAAGYTVDTVYFGGGTPTLLSLGDFERLMSVLHRCYRLTDGCEISAECNPATADREKLLGMRALGINRLSIGLQSIHENELSVLGRIHGFDDFKRIFEDARSADFDNISVDLMYGIPEQTLGSFRKSLITVADMAPEHVSSYGLKIEQGTPFYRMRDSLNLPDEDTEYEMYVSMSELLSERGYEKYEISNFARPDKYSRHNMRYWERRDYMGFGVAAHSCFSGERFDNSRDIHRFLRGEDIETERTVLTRDDDLREYVMLSLRLARGIDLEEFKERAEMDFFSYYPRAKELIEGEFFVRRGERIAFTDKGFFVSNTILSDMLDFGY